MDKIGLTGASGVMGQALRKKFPNYEWICFPEEGDILNPVELKNWLRESESWRGIVHFAAIVPTHLVDEDPALALRVNVEGTCALLSQVVKKGGAPWFFLASTGHVYASSPGVLTENSPTEPISLYGLTKLQAEQWAAAFASKHGLPVCIGRIFSCHSALHPKTYFIPSMVEKISNAPQGGVLEVRGLKGTRDFQSAEQVCAAIEFLFRKKATGIFNIASGQSVQLLDLVQKIQKKLHREDVKIIPLDQETSHLSASVDKLKKIGFTPGVDWEELLAIEQKVRPIC